MNLRKDSVLAPEFSGISDKQLEPWSNLTEPQFHHQHFLRGMLYIWSEKAFVYPPLAECLAHSKCSINSSAQLFNMSFPCMSDTNSPELTLHAQMFSYFVPGNLRTVIEPRVSTYNSQMAYLLTLVIIYKLWKQKDKQYA